MSKEPLIDLLVDIAQSQVGKREEGGNNLGPAIVEYQQSTWLLPGSWPWCAAFVSWVLQQWLDSSDVLIYLRYSDSYAAQKFRCRDASAFGWLKWAKDKHLTILSENDLAKKGDLVVFDFSHIGIVREDQKSVKSAIKTIEGNTNGKGERDSEAGDGVWNKTRAASLTRNYIRILD